MTTADDACIIGKNVSFQNRQFVILMNKRCLWFIVTKETNKQTKPVMINIIEHDHECDQHQCFHNQPHQILGDFVDESFCST